MLETAFGASPSLIALGVSSGCTLSSYLTSVGYFNQKLSTDALVGLQNLVVYLVQFNALVAGYFLDDAMDRRFGVMHTYAFRIIVMSMVSSLILLAVPFCESIHAVLLIGAILAATNATQFSSSTQLAATNVKGGGMFIMLGMTMGALLPMVTTELTGFTPGCTFDQALNFYIVSCIIGMLCIVVWIVEHYCALRAMRLASRSFEEPGDMFGAEAPEEMIPLSPTGRFIGSAYQSLARSSSLKTLDPESFAQIFSVNPMYSVGIFINFVVGFLLVPLFAKARPTTVQGLYLSKCLGDLLARAGATQHAFFCSTRGSVSGLERCWCVFVLALRTFLALLFVGALTNDRVEDGNTLVSYVTVMVIFAFGGYAFQMFDLDVQLQGTADEAWRKQVQRWHLVVMIAGQIVGVLIGLIWTLVTPDFNA